MTAENFEEFVRGQFPFRPDHPDYGRLREIVERAKGWRETGLAGGFTGVADHYSVDYLAFNRVTGYVDLYLNKVSTGAPNPTEVRNELIERTANAWAEGFVFGVLFERMGGHRQEGDHPPNG